MTRAKTAGQLIQWGGHLTSELPEATSDEQQALLGDAEVVAAVKKAGLTILGPALARLRGEAVEPAMVSSDLLESPTSPFKFDKTKNGWKLLEDVKEPEIIEATKLELVPFLKEGESFVGGEEMVRRARGELRANLGQRHAEELLEHQDQIPVEWRGFYLVFPGTVWRLPDGRRRVAGLGWSGGHWGLGLDYLVMDWDSYARLVRPCE